MGALARYVAKKFGVKTRTIVNPIVNACAVTPTTLLRNNPDRLASIVVNLGATAMYIAWDQGVGANHGIYVAPNGGSQSFLADEDGELVGYELIGIAITGAVDVFVVEVEAE